MAALLLSLAGCAGGQAAMTEGATTPHPCLEGPVGAALPDPEPQLSRPGPPTEAPPAEPDEAPRDDVTVLQVRFGEAEGLSYLEVVVGRVDVNDALPMVLGIHGLGDKPRVPTHPRIADDLPYRFIMPWAPDTWSHSGFTWLPVRVRDNKPAVLSSSLKEKADWLARFLHTLTHQRPTVGRPVVTGGSQGGMLVFTMAVHHPDVVGAALPVMGWLPPPLVPDAVDMPEAYPKIRSVHGTKDPHVPLGPTRDAVRELRALGLDVELVEYEGVGHHMTDAMDTQVGRWLRDMVRAQADTARGRDPAWHRAGP